MMPDISSDSQSAKLARHIFYSAEAQLEEAERHYRTLSFLPEGGDYGAAIPPSSRPTKSGIRNFIEDFTVGVATADAEKPLHVTITFNMLTFLEETYEWLGLNNYYVVFKTLGPEQCSNHEATQCWNSEVHYWPLSPRPKTLSGSSEKISQDLAVLVLRRALHARDARWRTTAAPNDVSPFLLNAATPSTMDSLRAAARGHSILSRGLLHPVCNELTAAGCIEAARQFLLQAKHASANADAYSSVAAFGLALLEMDAALRAAQRSDPALSVVTHLREAESWIQRGSPDAFLETTIANHVSQGEFAGILDLAGLLPNERFLALAREFSCILVEKWRANWEQCLRMLNTAGDFPPPLTQYLEAARLEAEFSGYSLSKIEEVVAELEESYNDAYPSSNQFRKDVAVIKQICKRPDILDTGRFVELVVSTSQWLPQGSDSALSELIIVSSGCRLGQVFPSALQLSRAIRYVHDLPDGMQRGRLFLTVYEYYARIGDMDSALQASLQALRLPWARDYLANSGGLDKFFASPRHYEKYADMVSSTDVQSVFLVECAGLTISVEPLELGDDNV